MHHRGLRFDQAVAPNGYAWWYVDALSDDGRYAMTAIAFVGSVFSPYYAAARRRGRASEGGADAVNYCAINVALYGPRGNRWAMTERGRSQVDRQSAALSIGPSSLRWSDDCVLMHIDEICAPVPRRMQGTLLVRPESLHTQSFALDDSGCHHWTPYAPRARIDVRMQHPDLTWSGTGYFDHNCGTAPLEDSFTEWTWSRASLSDRTVILYDTQPRGGAARSLAMQFRSGMDAEMIEAPAAQQLPRTRWGLRRQARSENFAKVVRTLEDAPFYSRSQLDVGLMGVRAPAIHETLSLQRFRSGWVRCLLPFRMPRITW